MLYAIRKQDQPNLVIVLDVQNVHLAYCRHATLGANLLRNAATPLVRQCSHDNPGPCPRQPLRNLAEEAPATACDKGDFSLQAKL